jgi:hypothetical protein
MLPPAHWMLPTNQDWLGISRLQEDKDSESESLNDGSFNLNWDESFPAGHQWSRTFVGRRQILPCVCCLTCRFGTKYQENSS